MSSNKRRFSILMLLLAAAVCVLFYESLSFQLFKLKLASKGSGHGSMLRFLKKKQTFLSLFCLRNTSKKNTSETRQIRCCRKWVHRVIKSVWSIFACLPQKNAQKNLLSLILSQFVQLEASSWRCSSLQFQLKNIQN